MKNRSLWIWSLVALAALTPYLNALQCGFAFDDEGLIRKNALVAAETDWLTTLASPYWPPPHQAGLYRPVVTASYRLQNGLGNGPFGFHLFNILIHLAVCLTAFSLLRKLFPGRESLSLIATLIFAVHPLHTEAVTGLVGRAELFSALFAMLAYRLWLRRLSWHSWIGTFLLFALAMASKEGAIGWLLLIGAHRCGLLGDGRGYLSGTGSISGARSAGDSPQSRIVADGAWLGGFCLYLILRFQVLGALIGLSRVDFVDNPIFAAGADMRILTALLVMAKGIGLLLWPLKLSADYSAHAISLPTNWLHPAALMLPALAAAVYLAIRYRRRCGAATWGLALYLAMLLPVSNLVVPIGTIMGERLLYLPSLGLILSLLVIVHQLLARLAPQGRQRLIVAGLSIAALVFLSGRTWSRNPDWNSSETLFSSVVSTQPRSVKGLANLGSALSKKGALAQAEALYRRSLELVPNYPAGLIGMGYVCIMQQKYAEAERLLTTARTQNPDNTRALLRLGNLYLELGRAGEGLECFDQLLALNRFDGDGWIGKASAHFMLSEPSESAAAWDMAQTCREAGTDYRRYLFAARRSAGMYTEALTTLESMIADTPANALYHHEMATLILERFPQRLDQGQAAAQRAVDLSPTTEYIGTVLKLYIRRGDCGGARKYLEIKNAVIQTASERDSLSLMLTDQCH